MSDAEAPRNRKERRAVARESGRPVAPPTSAPKLKLAQPDRSKPKEKTLLDLYEERKALLDQGQPFDPKYADGLVRDEGGNILEAGLGDDEPIGPVGQAVFWAAALGMLHFTFDVLVYNQYRQEIEWPPIFKRTLTMLPILFMLVWMLRSETASRFRNIRQVFYFVTSVAAGCYTIHVANKGGYFFVMKRTPPLGTWWIWSVIEMDVAFAAASIGAELLYLWWKGYTMF
ncbi:hypothetical protein LTR29_013576 [Friedmanniomyces endolithicus]|nr:hypothetical protein LTR29_013576 [Friedmanniomyces endolithicus]